MDFDRRLFHILVSIGIAIQVANLAWLLTSNQHWALVAFSGGALGMVLTTAARSAYRWLKLRVGRRLRQQRSIEPTAKISPHMVLSTKVLTFTTEIYMPDDDVRVCDHPFTDAPSVIQERNEMLNLENDIHHVCWTWHDSHAIECAEPDCNGQLDVDMTAGRSLLALRTQCPVCIEKNYAVSVSRLTVRK